MKKQEYLEYRDEPLDSILDFKGLRKSIKDFKEESAIEVLKRFHTTHAGYDKFLPFSLNRKDGVTADLGTHNHGVFSTAVCLETIAAYQKNVDECKDTINGKDWAWQNKEKRTVKDRRCTDSNQASNQRKEARRKGGNNTYGKEIAYRYFEFIIKELDANFGVSYGFLAKIATLVRFCNYLNHWGIKDSFIEKLDQEATRNKFYEICLDCILEFDRRLLMQKEGIHPFELYRFLQFVDKWGKEISDIRENERVLEFYVTKKSNNDQEGTFEERSKVEASRLKKQLKELNKKLTDFSEKKTSTAFEEAKTKEEPAGVDSNVEEAKAKEEPAGVDSNIDEAKVKEEPAGIDSNNPHDLTNEHKRIFDYFFTEVYLFAKYELYRQMSLNQSGDSKLYDPKRLIYALLVVYLDNKFSNTLVRNKALELIFSPYRNDRNATWATGQQVAMSKDGLMIITDNECICDLLGCESLNLSLLGFVNELKYIYDGYARTKRIEEGKILGWYPIHQRDKTPTSWTTAFTLSFIKRFCKLISLELSRKAKERFRSNYRKPDIGWNDLYDCTAVKAKIRLMFPQDINGNEDGNIVEKCKYRTAILFGPPGTGKTTYGRALATKLGLDYLELTPGDFFSGGEDSILVTINDIFEHLLHLKNTVVFIDEIDDLVKNRNQDPGHPYDRRSLFVNSLLPRFQELHDNQNIILLMATNNIERVDRAISRMGRVDLVIPVGAISPHGRLKYFQDFKAKHKAVFEQLNLLAHIPEVEIGYLNATESFNFSTLKHYTEMILDEMRRGEKDNTKKSTDRILEFFSKETAKKRADNPALIWQETVIKKIHTEKGHTEKNRTKEEPIKEELVKEEYIYDTRPKHSDGDFRDFGYFDYLQFLDTKEAFQKAFVELFHALRKKPITKNDAETISKTINEYCSNFDMKDTAGGRTQRCGETFYNILTPFYDDIDDAIGKTNSEEIRSKLDTAKKELSKLIYDRTMLTT